MLDEIYENPLVPKVDEKLTAEEAMELTWRIALQGVGFVRSNPLVGAVCVDKDHRFVAAAYHEAFGKPHAEQALIAKMIAEGLESKLQEGTIYVSLEPCAHVGKTPSCA